MVERAPTPAPAHTTSSSSSSSSSSKEEDIQNRTTQKSFSSLGSFPTREPSGRVLCGSRDVSSCSSASSIRSVEVRGPPQEAGRSIGRHVPGGRPDAIVDQPQGKASAAKVPARTAALTTAATTTTTATTTSGAWTMVQKGTSGKYVPPIESSPHHGTRLEC